jgi:hypothetical protein
MNKEIKKSLSQSALVAVLISLILPAIWLSTMGYTSRTPIIEKGFIESMTIEEQSKWEKENYKQVTFVEHIKGIPSFIKRSWVGYLQSSFLVFVVVFMFNFAYMSGVIRKKP